ncbi:MAG: glycine cleavage system protein H [Candidatus Thorarchaeota archaeon]
MKIEEFEFPEDRYYLKNHAWLKESNDSIQVGITSLGESLSKGIVHIDLPEIGDTIEEGDTLIAYETIKAVSQITLPFDSIVVDVNELLWETPGKINEDPYNTWIVSVKGELSNYMSVDEAYTYYRELIREERNRYTR